MSVLSAEERGLIDAAIASGRVMKVPTGVSGLDEEILWDKATKTLKYVDPAVARDRLVRQVGMCARSTKVKRRRTRAVSPDVEQRRRKVSHLIDAGMTGSQIAERLKVPVRTVWADARRIGKSLSRQTRQALELQARRSDVRQAYSPDMTAQDIAQKVNLPVKQVRNHLRALGLKAAQYIPAKIQTTEAERAERRAKVTELVENGLTMTQIAKCLDVHLQTVRNDVRKLGLTPVKARRASVAAV